MQQQSKIFWNLTVLFLVIFVDVFALGMLIPIAPTLFTNPQSEFFLIPHSWPLSWGKAMFGLVLGIYPLVQFFAAPILGQMSDRYGRKRVLLISLVGTFLSFIMLGLSVEFKLLWLLLLGRVLDAFTGGNISVAMASVADMSSKKNKAKLFGLVGAAMGLGFILGPYLGARFADPHLVSWFNLSVPFWMSALLSGFNLILIFGLYVETLHQPISHLKINWSESFSHIRAASTHKTLKEVFTVSFLFFSGYVGATTVFSLYLITHFHFTEKDISNFFLLIGIGTAFTQGYLTRVVSRRWSSKQVLSFAFFLVSLFIALFLVPRSREWLYVVAILSSVVVGLALANLPVLVSDQVSIEEQGEAMGISTSVNCLAQAIPAILAGLIAAKYSVSLAILVGAILVLIAGLYYVRVKDDLV